MKRPDAIIIDGRAYSWRVLTEQRRAQLEAWRKSQGEQPALFALREDCRPKFARTAVGRYQEPSLLDCLQEDNRE